MQSNGSDRPRTRNYARIERERRFLVQSLPATVDPNDFERLRDLYVQGTHLRLRRMESPDGTLLLVKLGQKVVDPEAPHDPRHRQMTTLYLDPAEEAPLQTLPGRRSVKRRYRIAEQGRTFMIDVYEAPARAAGLMIAEVETETDAELAAIALPAWAVREVTDDGDYSGAKLADL